MTHATVAEAARFDAMYEADADPWNVATRWYERRKIALVMAMLPSPRYASAFEPACGTGVLTRELAARCDLLVASDFAPRAVDATKSRTRDLPNVRVQQLALPHHWPEEESFGLIVLSEWAYYLESTHLELLAQRCASSSQVLACHFRPDFGDRRQTTSCVHETLAATLAMPLLAHYEDDDVRIDVWGCAS